MASVSVAGCLSAIRLRPHTVSLQDEECVKFLLPAFELNGNDPGTLNRVPEESEEAG